MQHTIRQLIAEGRLEEAIKALASFVPDEAILLQGRLAGLNRQNNAGLLSYDEYARKLAQISAAALDLIKKAPDTDAVTQLGKASPQTRATTTGLSSLEADGLKKSLELIIRRLNAVREAHALAVDANQRFAYEQQIAKLEKDIADLKAKLGFATNTSSDSVEPPPPTAAHIYFSYAWGDANESGESREDIVNKLYDALKEEGFEVKRDKMDLGYRGLISEFMKEIGRGHLIVVAISDKYLRSPYCMHELNEIYRNSRQDKQAFVERVFPMRVERVDMSKPAVLKSYLQYWKEQEKEWSDLVKDPSLPVGEQAYNQFIRIKNIYQNFSDLFLFLQDMNALSKDLLAQDDFAVVKQAIRQRLEEV